MYCYLLYYNISISYYTPIYFSICHLQSVFAFKFKVIRQDWTFTLLVVDL